MQQSSFSDEHKEHEVHEGQPPSEPSGPTPISEFAGRDDFPECVRGRHVDIGGFSGVVSDIVHNSLKVRNAEGFTKSFNFHTVRRLFGPRPEPPPLPPVEQRHEPVPERRVSRTERPEPAPEPPRRVIAEPDYNAPVVPIREFTGRADYPECILGQHVEIAGYTGVVVEIVNRSLKVRSPEETTRSYNADVLKKLHPPQAA